MAANINPIYSITPNVGTALIGTTSAQVKSDGTSAGTGTDLMYCAFIAGANGSYVQRVRFNAVANATTNSVATILRIYLSTVSASLGAAVGATTSANTFLLTEISVPVINAAGATNSTNYYEVCLNMAIPTSRYIHVSQHTAQTANGAWNAKVFGGDY